MLQKSFYSDENVTGRFDDNDNVTDRFDDNDNARGRFDEGPLMMETAQYFIFLVYSILAISW